MGLRRIALVTIPALQLRKYFSIGMVKSHIHKQGLYAILFMITHYYTKYSYATAIQYMPFPQLTQLCLSGTNMSQ